MHRELVNLLPLWGFDLFMIICVTLFATFIYFSARQFFPRLLTDSLSSAFTVLGTSYGFILGFTISILWHNYSGALKVTVNEATDFNIIINNLIALAPDAQLKIIDGIQNYIDVMKNHEWPEMQAGNITNAGWSALNHLYSIMYSIKPDGTLEKMAYSDILGILDRIEVARVSRLVSVDPLLNLGLRWVIIFGAAFIIYSVSVHDTKNKVNNLMTIILVCTLVSFNLGLVFLLNYPFSGSLAITGERLLVDTPIRLQHVKNRLIANTKVESIK